MKTFLVRTSCSVGLYKIKGHVFISENDMIGIYNDENLLIAAFPLTIVNSIVEDKYLQSDS